MSAPNGPDFQPPEGFVKEGSGPVTEEDRLAAAFMRQAQEKGLASLDEAQPPTQQPVGAEEHLERIAGEAEAQAQQPPGGELAPEGEPGQDAEGQPVATLSAADADVLVDMGNGQSVPLEELVRGTLLQADYTRKTQELSAQRQALEAERSQVQAQQHQGLTHLNTLIQQLEYEVNASQPNPQEMEQLRSSDPAEYSARMLDMQRRAQALQAAQYQRQQLEAQQMRARVPQERAMLAAKAPEVFSPDKFATTYADVGRYATSPEGGGLSPEEWDQVFDHRHVLLVWKAQQYDAQMRQRPRITRNLQNLPKVRPGVQSSTRPPTAGETSERQYSAALDTLKKNPEGQTVDQQAAAFLALSKRNREQAKQPPQQQRRR